MRGRPKGSKGKKIDTLFTPVHMRVECWNCGSRYKVSLKNCPRCREENEDYRTDSFTKIDWARLNNY